MANDDPVSTWDDQSTNSFDIVQAVAGAKPTYKTGILNTTLPVVRFDGGDYLTKINLTLSSISSADQCSIITVMRQTGASATNILLSWSGAASENLKSYPSYNDVVIFDMGNSTIGAGRVSSVQPYGWDDAFHIVEYYRSTDGTAEIIIDGNLVSSIICSDTVDNTLTADLNIGNSGAVFFTGDVYMLLVKERVLTIGERGNLRKKIAAKTGITVNANINGCWTWFNGQKSITSGGKTFIGSINSSGVIRVCEFDATGKLSHIESIQSTTILDDHANASLLCRLSDSRLMAFYSYHNGTRIYMKISTNANDSTAWGAVSEISAAASLSYNYAIQLDGEANDPIYVFYCSGAPAQRIVSYVKSTDDGANWGAEVQVFKVTDERPYLHIAQNGNNRIDFVVSDGQPNEVATNSIYHFYYEADHYYTSDGTEICDTVGLPIEPADATKVYDGAVNRAWNWDIAIDGAGNPVIAYVNFVGGSADHRYRYARWNGISWDDYEIVAGGTFLYAAETYYSCGLCLDHSDPDIVYLSINGALYKYVTADGGATWASTYIGIGYRPMVPYPTGIFDVVYWSGTYDGYTEFSTQISSYPMLTADGH